MNRPPLAIILVLLTGIIFLTNCSKPDTPTSLLFRIVTIEKSSSPQNADPQCRVSFSYPEFAHKVPIADTLNSYINRLFQQSFQTVQTGDINRLVEGLLSEYKSFAADMPDMATTWEYQANCKVVHETPDIISLCCELYSNTGGAHGLYTVVYSSFDKKNARQFHIGDIVSKNKFVELTAIAETVFRENQNLQPGESLSDAGYWFENDQFFLPNNFALLKQGLIFFYNPYEIAPYAAGSFEILLPYEKINALLLAHFQK